MKILKKVFLMLIIGCILVTTLGFSETLDSSIEFLKSNEIDDWGIIALKAAGKNTDGYDIKKPSESKNMTDYQSYVLARLSQGKKPSETIDKIKNSQLDNGKFADTINKTGDDLVNSHIWGIITLYSAGEEDYDKEKALEWLENNQLEDGSFPIYVGDSTGSIDLTLMAVCSYKILGKDSSDLCIKKAMSYVKENIDRKESSESLSWYILANIMLNESVDSKIINKLNEYSLENGFKHLKMTSKANYMATWHGVLALADLEKESSFIDRLHNRYSFKDLSNETKYYESIINLVNKNILSGYGDNTFKPKKSISRAEFATVLVSALDLEGSNYSNKKVFNDLENHWAYKNIMIAYEKGYINGISENSFSPNKNITGAELATILVRVKGLEDEIKLYENGKWYKGYVDMASDNNLLYESFNPEEIVTRGECAESINRLIKGDVK